MQAIVDHLKVNRKKYAKVGGGLLLGGASLNLDAHFQFKATGWNPASNPSTSDNPPIETTAPLAATTSASPAGWWETHFGFDGPADAERRRQEREKKRQQKIRDARPSRQD